MSKKMRSVIIFLIVLLAGTIIVDVAKQLIVAHIMKNFKMPPETVETVLVKSVVWRPKIDAVGTLKAIHGVQVNAQVAGQVVSIHFHPGDEVTEGQFLIQLDDSLDVATLDNDQATLSLAQTEYNRQINLFSQHATSKQALDQAKAKLDQAKSSVAADKVTISRKNISAPFAGKIGIVQVDLGDYVTAGQSLVSLQTMDPLYVDFYLPEQSLKDILINQPIQLTISAYPNNAFNGKVLAVDSRVNPQTRNFMVRAEVPNTEGKLYPGVFANLSVLLPTQENVITIPQTAITYTLYGDSVYLIKRDGKDEKKQPIIHANLQSIVLGEQHADVVVVKSGLKAGDEVVNAGQVKIQDHAQVVINNTYSLSTGE